MHIAISSCNLRRTKEGYWEPWWPPETVGYCIVFIDGHIRTASIILFVRHCHAADPPILPPKGYGDDETRSFQVRSLSNHPESRMLLRRACPKRIRCRHDDVEEGSAMAVLV